MATPRACTVPKSMPRLPEKHRVWLEADVAQLLRELKAPLARIAADASALLSDGGSSSPNARVLYRIDHSIMILERSIEQLMEINDWRSNRDGGPRKMVREDFQR